MAVRVSKRFLAGARPKYGNRKTVRDGITFDSKAEADRWSVLSVLAKTGHISDLERQIRYDLIVNGEKICSYVADFRYYDRRKGAPVVEDVKSGPTRTREYRLKKKLMRAIHGVDVTEVM